MLTSYVLRLRPDRLLLGELVGEVEDVEARLVVPIRDLAGLLAFLHARGDSAEGRYGGASVPDPITTGEQSHD